MSDFSLIFRICLTCDVFSSNRKFENSQWIDNNFFGLSYPITGIFDVMQIRFGLMGNNQ